MEKITYPCCKKCEIYLDYKDSYQCSDGDCDCHSSPTPDIQETAHYGTESLGSGEFTGELKQPEEALREWEKEFVEKGADLEHDRWARWQKHVNSKILPAEYDTLMQIDSEWIERWNRQINTPYAELSEPEKESDRKETRNYLPLVRQLLASQKTALEQEFKKTLNSGKGMYEIGRKEAVEEIGNAIEMILDKFIR